MHFFKSLIKPKPRQRAGDVPVVALQMILRGNSPQLESVLLTLWSPT